MITKLQDYDNQVWNHIYCKEKSELKFQVWNHNYTISPSSLLCVCNWSLKFQVSTISPLSFQNEPYKSFY